MNNQDKGYLYEIQIRDYIINELKFPAYLWKDTPETILLQNNIIGSHNHNRLKRIENKTNPLRDTGIDVIQVENDKCSLVQCKNGYKKGVKMEDLAGFMCWISTLDTLKGYVYYTDKLSQNILSLPKNKRIEYIKHPFIQNIIEENNVLEKYEPYDYQEIAVNKFTEHFKISNRGILSMPCGTGKTMTSYLISQKFKQIIILSPLKEFAKQNLNRYIEYGYENKTLLVSSDGCRDVKEIKKFIKSNKSFIISSTFCSIDCLIQVLDKTDNPLIIIDEFHNLSKNNIIDEEDDFYKVLNSEHKIMFMSATPRVYELEDEMEDTEHIFGEIFYKMNFNEAIENKFITDYKIWLPSIHEDNSQLNKELSIYEIDKVIKGKCNFFFSCLLNNGSKKCIIYCQDTNEINLMIEAMNKLNEFYCLDIRMNQITASNTEKQRIKVLDDFREGTDIQLLFSVRILDECIDIPSCDSIFITYPTKSKIRTIQRMSRCMRINKSNSFKVGNIFIWCDEYDKILETLSGIKEYNIMFKDKIKVNNIGFFVEGVDKGCDADNKLVEKYIIGVKEFRCISWEEKLEEVKKYIDENDRLPLETKKNYEEKKLRIWLSHQQQNYKKKDHIMKNPEIYDKWTEFIDSEKYNKYFLSNEQEWSNKLEHLKNFIISHKNKPMQKSTDEIEKKISSWLRNQRENYILKQECMKNKNIYNKWTEFINDENYSKYLLTNEEKWKQMFEKVKTYIDETNNISSGDIQLTQWINSQKRNFITKKNGMGNDEIYSIWKQFITNDKYKKLFINNIDKQLIQWEEKLYNLKKYIDENNERPSNSSKDIKIKQLAEWINGNQKNYKTKINNMRNEKIYNLWNEFINDEKYNIFFKSNEEIWIDKLNRVKNYINLNNKRPSQIDKNDEIKILGRWINQSQIKYRTKERIMSDPEIYNKWTDFITNPQYKQYFD